MPETQPLTPEETAELEHLLALHYSDFPEGMVQMVSPVLLETVKKVREGAGRLTAPEKEKNETRLKELTDRQEAVQGHSGLKIGRGGLFDHTK